MLIPVHTTTWRRPDAPHRSMRRDDQWVARIAGPCERYGLAREFVKPLLDYSGAKERGGTMRNIQATWMLEEGRVYELNLKRGRKNRRRLVLVSDGEAIDIDQDEAIRVTEASGAPRRTANKDWRRPLGVDVLTAAKRRIRWTFDKFERVYLSGPSGKDSGVVMHLACQEARRRGRKIGVLYVDLEAQYQLTIDNVREMFALYSDVIDPHWVALPLRLRNAVSMEHPYWVCWDPWAEFWVRNPPPEAATDRKAYPFHRKPVPPDDDAPREAMEFEEFVEEFGRWYAGDKSCACLVAIRTDESLNRWRSIVRRRKSRLEGKAWTAWKGDGLFNVYPIYDWRTEDVWTYYGRERLPYNKLYDQMYRAGLPLSQQRICHPYGDDQRRGLNMFQIIEPETWTRVVARVAGANQGALYAGKNGNILGNGKITCPPGHTWESYTRFLLDSLPEFEADHYRMKFEQFMRWWADKYGVAPIPDAPDEELSERFPRKGGPSWYRLAKCILKNDRMCRSLSFSQHVSGNYERYRKIMRRRREAQGWSL